MSENVDIAGRNEPQTDTLPADRQTSDQEASHKNELAQTQEDFDGINVTHSESNDDTPLRPNSIKNGQEGETENTNVKQDHCKERQSKGSGKALSKDDESGRPLGVDFDRVYRTSFFLPFGIYNNAESSPPGKNETFVGHEKQRSAFIRHLLNSGKSCAYLITGQRGAGKTNFVKHCLNEYENYVLGRYEAFKRSRPITTDWLPEFAFILLLTFPAIFDTLTLFSQSKLLSIILVLPSVICLIKLYRNISTVRIFKNAIKSPLKQIPTLNVPDLLGWKITIIGIYALLLVVVFINMFFSEFIQGAGVSILLISLGSISAIAFLSFYILRKEKSLICAPYEALTSVEEFTDKSFPSVIEKTLADALKDLSDPDKESYFRALKTSYKNAAQLSWIFKCINLWNPSIRMHINLGFDEIGHKNIILNLLREIRQEYYEKFISWKSKTALLMRGVLLSLACIASFICIQVSPGFVKLFKVDFIPEQYGTLVISLGILTILLLLFRLLPVLPYRYNLKKIDFALDRLTAVLSDEVSINATKGVKLPLQFKQSKKYAPLSSRDIEYQFLKIVETVRSEENSILGTFVSLPKPEITIIFDELDKIGGKRDYGSGEKDALFDETLKVFDTVRSSKIRELLSDLKNIISSEYCRFIFIGGRHLRDEWLAELTMRDQLLPSIFDKEIYLPSLLSDKKQFEPSNHEEALLFRVDHYFEQKHARAKESLSTTKNSPQLFVKNIYHNFPRSGLSLPINEREKILSKNFLFLFYHMSTEVKSSRTTSFEQSVKGYSEKIYKQFLIYLAYRSFGLPKRIEEVLSGFVVPKNKVLPNQSKCLQQGKIPPSAINDIEECEDVILLTDIDLARIQFINKIYNIINLKMGRLLYNRDDKVVTSIFFLSDFILKFHGRAFSWTSLEKLEEIIDLHHSPDLRNMLALLIDSYMGEILRPVLNGMFEFRFTSTIASEIQYLSRFSPMESAAFNFTLDESHLLKDMHLRKLDANKGTFEDCTALAELYEYDEDYDNAIREYHRALVFIDEALTKMSRSEEGKKTSYLEVLNILDEGNDAMSISYIVHWAISRLRVMLRIGLVYEQRRDFERAGTWYHESHVLSRRLLKACLQEQVKLVTPQYYNSKELEPESLSVKSTYFLPKHLHLLYQAVFAKAWLAEKDATGIDMSFVVVNTELYYLEQLLPFPLTRKEESFKTHVKQGLFSHATFGLIKSEMYKKSGDLCFYKGAYLPENLVNDGDSETELHSPLAKHGYLYRASYFYACSLHYLRQFNVHHQAAGESLFGTGKNEQPAYQSTFSPDQLPDYPLIEGASSLLQFAETLLARIDLQNVLKGLTIKEGQGLTTDHIYAYTVSAHCCTDTWLKGKCFNSFKLKFRSLLLKHGQGINLQTEPRSEYFSLHTPSLTSSNMLAGFVNKASLKKAHDSFINSWLGTCAKKDSNDKSNHANHRIINSTLVSGCSLEKLVLYTVLVNMAAVSLKRAGHVEEASHEYRRGVESLALILESFVLISEVQGATVGEGNSETSLSTDFIKYVISRAVYFAESSHTLNNEYWTNKSAHQDHTSRTNKAPSKLVIAALRLNTVAQNLGKKYEGAGLTEPLENYFAKKLNGEKIVELSQYPFSYAQILKTQYEDYLEGERKGDSKVDLVGTAKDLTITLEPSKMFTQIADKTSKILLRRCVLHRSTVLSRLSSLQHVLVRDYFQDNVNEWTEQRALELLELQEQYGAKNHFLITQTAISCYVVASCLEDAKMKSYLYRRAQELLFKSQQLYTMRSEYYKALGEMFYLFDDFNDRSVHHGKAQQIACSVLTHEIEGNIKNELSKGSLSL